MWADGTFMAGGIAGKALQKSQMMRSMKSTLTTRRFIAMG
jgi:hypothetical protein